VSFPNYANKHTAHSTPLVTPERFVRHLQERGLLEGYTPPEGIILLYQPPFVRALLAREPHRGVSPYPDWLFLLERTAGRVGVLAYFGIGGPAVATAVDTLAALGTRRYLNLGAAGGLQPDGRVGDLVVCDRAVRDEGSSHHYLPPSRYALPSASLTHEYANRLRAAGQPFRTGPTWTIDAPYRETVEELRQYRDEGVLTVDMEAAALFAVAEHRGLDVAAAFVLSDTLTEAEWTPDFGSPDIQHGLDVLVGVAIDLLAGPR
jgi:nucleoside phosphorylase